MLRAFVCLALSILFWPGFLPVQSAGQAHPNPVPDSLSADVYAIYSSLMPIGVTAGRNWPHDLWLVANTTTPVILPDRPCNPTDGRAEIDSSTNPHFAVAPTEDRRQDYLELMQDFDLHCHERWTLASNAWKTKVPVRLLNWEEQKAFRSLPVSSMSFIDHGKFKGGPALYLFSNVYFNAAHTVALVYAVEAYPTGWCGSPCVNESWFAFQLKNGRWSDLHWRDKTVVSGVVP